MRGNKLREILSDIRNALQVSGSKHAESVGRLEDALSGIGDRSVDEVLGTISTGAESLGRSRWEIHLKELTDAGVNEPAFLRALTALSDDRTIKKADLEKIASAYAGYVEKKSTAPKLVDAIKTRFYSLVYDKASGDMSKRATPW